MPRIFEGQLGGVDGRYAIVVSRYNDNITAKLLEGAVATLKSHGIPDESIDVAWVPGAWEIPLIAERLAESESYAAVICLGAVIRGATAHFEHVAGQCAAGIQRAQLETGVPVVFGVLTTDTIDQALERAGSKAGNKGYEAAEVAVEMADLLRQLPKGGPG